LLPTRSFLADSANITLTHIDPRIAERAASIRAQHNLRFADALIAATALESQCTHLVANDRVFTRVPDLTALIVSGYTSNP
jgi:predicted nucleic acid-binding protein